jgi:hypothetical protein
MIVTITIYLHKFDHIEYFMYKVCIVPVLHVDESIVFMYVFVYFDMFYILWHVWPERIYGI